MKLDTYNIGKILDLVLGKMEPSDISDGTLQNCWDYWNYGLKGYDTRPSGDRIRAKARDILLEIL
jgi:hypothetical protein